MGRFVTEIDLLQQPSVRDAFKAAHLVSNHPSDEEVRELTRKYILEQLRYIPGSSKIVDRYAVMCNTVLANAIQNNEISFPDSSPAILDKTIREKVSEQLQEELRRRRHGLVSGLQQQNISGLPNTSDLQSATLQSPLTWRPALTQDTSQSSESYNEQVDCLNICLESVDMYTAGSATFIKHHLLTGPPGTGKTHLMTHVMAYAVSKGLDCCLTSLAAERASTFSGKHINAIFPFPVTGEIVVQHYVEHAIRKLMCDPVKFKLVESIDVLFIEEVSMISAELWAAIDLVLQHVMESNVPFGGKLVISTGDFLQLPPPNGTLLVLSMSILTNFWILQLKRFVRMNNVSGQRLLQLFDHPDNSKEQLDEMVDIIATNCTFASTWDGVDDSSLRVFARRAAERNAIDSKIAQIKNSATHAFHTYTAVDEVSVTNTEQWVAASDWQQSRLDQLCGEQRQLFAFKGAVMRLTQNKLPLNIFQGTFCSPYDGSMIKQFNDILNYANI